MNSRYYDSYTGRFINADSALYHSMVGYNMFAYCNNNPVMFVDYYGESAASLFLSWLTGAGAFAATEPTFIGEIVLAGGIVIIGCIWLGEKISENVDIIIDFDDNMSDPAKSITQDTNITDSKSEINTKDEYDPNPYRRSGEKKQNRENRTKARKKTNWEPRNNKRDGKPAKPKSHTPSKKGHKKYFAFTNPIEIFEVHHEHLGN